MYLSLLMYRHISRYTFHIAPLCAESYGYSLSSSLLVSCNATIPCAPHLIPHPTPHQPAWAMQVVLPCNSRPMPKMDMSIFYSRRRQGRRLLPDYVHLLSSIPRTTSTSRRRLCPWAMPSSSRRFGLGPPDPITAP